VFPREKELHVLTMPWRELSSQPLLYPCHRPPPGYILRRDRKPPEIVEIGPQYALDPLQFREIKGDARYRPLCIVVHHAPLEFPHKEKKSRCSSHRESRPRPPARWPRLAR